MFLLYSYRIVLLNAKPKMVASLKEVEDIIIARMILRLQLLVKMRTNVG